MKLNPPTRGGTGSDAGMRYLDREPHVSSVTSPASPTPSLPKPPVISADVAMRFTAKPPSPAFKCVRRDDPVICPCGKRVVRKSKTQTFCSRRCRQRDYWNRRAIAKISSLTSRHTRHSTSPVEKPCIPKSFEGEISRSRGFAGAPLNLLGGGSWRASSTPCLHPDLLEKIRRAEIGELRMPQEAGQIVS
jgi:hypothetical protein